MTKVCTKCKEEKSLDQYFQDRRNVNTGRMSWCKSCDYKKKQTRYRLNREEILAQKQAYYKQNKEKIKKYKDNYYQINKDLLNLKNKEYRHANKDSIKIKKSLYAKANRGKLRLKYNNKRKSEHIFRLSDNVRKRIIKVFRRNKISKRNNTAEILGCTFEQLQQHLEAQFKPGMTWENQGQWHIDHIIPLASAKTEEEIYKLCHYTNLQPLWAAENLSKGAKILPNDQNPQA